MTQGPFGWMQLPEEIRDQMMQQAETARLEQLDVMHGIRTAFAEMSIEHLEHIDTLLHNLAAHDTDNVFAITYAVVSHEVLAHRKNLCPVCMKDHDKLAEELLVNDWPSMPVGDALPNALDGSLTYAEIMDAYHVEPEDVAAGPTGRMRCTGVIEGQGACGLVYVSLTDRMIKKPNDCHGCLDKSAHG
jgi:hypothetical protein